MTKNSKFHTQDSVHMVNYDVMCYRLQKQQRLCFNFINDFYSKQIFT